MPLGKHKRRRHRDLLSDMQRAVDFVGIADRWVSVVPGQFRVYYSHCASPVGVCRLITAEPRRLDTRSNGDRCIENPAAQLYLTCVKKDG